MRLATEDARYECTDTAGDLVISARQSATDGFGVCGLANVRIDGECGYVDAKGALAISAQYDDSYRLRRMASHVFNKAMSAAK